MTMIRTSLGGTSQAPAAKRTAYEPPGGAGPTNVQDALAALARGGVAPVIITGDAAIPAGTQAVAIVRDNPTTTTLQLPTVVGAVPLAIFDWSTNVVDHRIILTPNGVETIMRQPTWSLRSNAVVLSSMLLRPSENLSGWYK